MAPLLQRVRDLVRSLGPTLEGDVANSPAALGDPVRLRPANDGDRFALVTFEPEDDSSPPRSLGDPLGVSNLGRTLMRRALDGGSIQVVDDAAADDELRSEAAAQEIGAAVALPIQVRGRTVGVASLFFDRQSAGEVRAALTTLRATAAPPTLAAPPTAPDPQPVSTVVETPEPVASPAPKAPVLPTPGMFDLVTAVVGEAVLRLDAEFDRAEEMSQANRLKSEFISVLSHELRSPLTYVYGFSELLSGREVSSEQVKRVAENMHREASLMLRLVDDLLDLSRMEMGRYHIEAHPFRLMPEVEQLVEQVQGESQLHQITAEGDAELIVEADPVRVRQVLQNLLNNAVRYSPNGGRVAVRVAVEPGDKMARIEVSDQGVGIPADEIARVFEKFHRVEGDLKQRVRGSGLGLAICQAIVEGHRGQIWAESTLGEGSRFTFTLPVGERDALDEIEDDPICDREPSASAA